MKKEKKLKRGMDEELLLQIGSKIVYFRRLKKMRQIDLAEAAGINESYLSKLERGKNLSGGSLAVFINIAKALDVKIEDILP